MVLPCFNKIKECFPDDNLILLTNKPVSAKAPSVASVMPAGFFSEEITYAIGTRNIIQLVKLLFQLRKVKANLLINLTATRSIKSSKRDLIFFRFAGISTIIGTPTKIDHELKIDTITGKTEWEAIRLKKRIAELAEINLNNSALWDLHLTETEEQIADKLLAPLQQKPFFAISTGTKLQANDWGSKNWSFLIHKLSLLFQGLGLVILGAQSDKENGDLLLRSWANESINLCGQTTPRISAVILKKARLFIGHDSGPLHIAGAVNISTIGIYSARNLPGRWFPPGNNNTIIYYEVDCAGCGLETCIIQQKKCILSIQVDEVYNTAIKKLATKEQLNFNSVND